MITDTDRVWIMPAGSTTPLSGPMTRAAGEGWLQRYQNRGNRGPCVYELAPVLICAVCGELGQSRGGYVRCKKHWHRNPCVIEGCKRSTQTRLVKVSESGAMQRLLTNDEWICGEHWRAFVPPGCAERRIFNRVWQRARRRRKRFGDDAMWADGADAAYWRIWAGIIRRARSRARGDVDMDEINRVMGW